MVHGKSSKGKALEEKQLKRYRRSLKRTRAKSRNPSVEENEKRRPAAVEEKADCRRLLEGKAPTSSTTKKRPRPAEPAPGNLLNVPDLVHVSGGQEVEDVEEAVPLLTTSGPELPSLETPLKEVKAPLSPIVSGDPKSPDEDIVTHQDNTSFTKEKPASSLASAIIHVAQEELVRESSEEVTVETAEPIKVIVTQEEEEEEEEEAVKENEEEIVRLEELAAKAKALASWKRAVSPARKPVSPARKAVSPSRRAVPIKEETAKSTAGVEEAPKIVSSDNLKLIDRAAEESTKEKAAPEAELGPEKVTDVKTEKPGEKSEESSGLKSAAPEDLPKEEFNFEESLGWTVQGRKGRKGKKGLSKLRGIISDLQAEEAEKKDPTPVPTPEPQVLSFEEAARQVEAESAFSRKAFAASLQVDVKSPQVEDLDTDSSGWEVIEVSDDSQDEVTDVKEVAAEVAGKVKERMCEQENGQRWVEEMNAKNRKKMEAENSRTTDSSASFSQSTFWREPISQVPSLPKEEKKPAGISLPTSEMTYDWMDDDAAMGAIDTDDEDMDVDKKKEPAVAKPVLSYADAAKKVEEVKPKGIALPTDEMTFDWMNDDDAVGTMDSDDDDQVQDNRENLSLNLKSPADAPEKKNEDVPEQFSPVHYWRDPIPDILDPDEPLKNAEKSERKSEKPKVAKPKSWLATNMAGMFDRKPKPKVKVEKKQPEKKTTAPDVKPSIPTVESLKTEKSKEEKKELPKEIPSPAGSKPKQEKPKIVLNQDRVWLDKWKFDDAEARFYERQASKQVEKSEKGDPAPEIENKKRCKEKSKGRIVKEITEETHEKVEVVYKVPEKMDNKELKEKLVSIEAENKEMRKSLAQLSETIRTLTARVNLLERESRDEGVDMSYSSPTTTTPFCPIYDDCTCLAKRKEAIL